MKRFATANWKGSGKEGKGTNTTQSGVLKDTQYSFSSRFESGAGTNPEELVAAAHAGCFTMKLSFVLALQGLRLIILIQNAPSRWIRPPAPLQQVTWK